jgi:hypothetical protein
MDQSLSSQYNNVHSCRMIIIIHGVSNLLLSLLLLSYAQLLLGRAM